MGREFSDRDRVRTHEAVDGLIGARAPEHFYEARSAVVRLLPRPRWGRRRVEVRCGRCARQYVTTQCPAQVRGLRSCTVCRNTDSPLAWAVRAWDTDRRPLAVRALEGRGSYRP